MEARCMRCGCPRGDLMFDVMAKYKDDPLGMEICDECRQYFCEKCGRLLEECECGITVMATLHVTAAEKLNVPTRREEI